MFGFRRSQTPQDVQEKHSTVLDLIEQVTELRGRLRAVEAEWDDMRAQIRKGYQRLEKAHERLELARSSNDELVQEELGQETPSFAKKWARIKGVS